MNVNHQETSSSSIEKQSVGTDPKATKRNSGLFSFFRWFKNSSTSRESVNSDTLSAGSCDSINSTYSTGTVASFSFVPPNAYKNHIAEKCIAPGPETDTYKARLKQRDKIREKDKNITLRKKYNLFFNRDTLLKPKATEDDVDDNSKSLPLMTKKTMNSEEERMHRRTASESSKIRKAGAYCHVKGKRKAPQPPGGSDDANFTASLRRKKRTAPPPPVEKIITTLEKVKTYDKIQYVDADVIFNDSLKLDHGILKPAKETENTTSNLLPISNSPNTSARSSYVEAPVSPRPWYKRNTNRDSVVNLRKDKDHKYEPVEVQYTRNSEAVNAEPDKKKEEKRKSGLSFLTNISELDREASEIVKKTEIPAEMPAFMRAKLDQQEQNTDSLVSPKRKSAKDLIAKFNAITNVTKVTVNTAFFGAARETGAVQKEKRDYFGRKNDDAPKKLAAKQKKTEGGAENNIISINPLMKSESASVIKSKSEPKETPKLERKSWYCPKCSLENDYWRIICSVCSTIKPYFDDLTSTPVMKPSEPPKAEAKQPNLIIKPSPQRLENFERAKTQIGFSALARYNEKKLEKSVSVDEKEKAPVENKKEEREKLIKMLIEMKNSLPKRKLSSDKVNNRASVIEESPEHDAKEKAQLKSEKQIKNNDPPLQKRFGPANNEKQKAKEVTKQIPNSERQKTPPEISKNIEDGKQIKVPEVSSKQVGNNEKQKMLEMSKYFNGPEVVSKQVRNNEKHKSSEISKYFNGPEVVSKQVESNEKLKSPETAKNSQNIFKQTGGNNGKQKTPEISKYLDGPAVSKQVVNNEKVKSQPEVVKNSNGGKHKVPEVSKQIGNNESQKVSEVIKQILNSEKPTESSQKNTKPLLQNEKPEASKLVVENENEKQKVAKEFTNTNEGNKEKVVEVIVATTETIYENIKVKRTENPKPVKVSSAAQTSAVVRKTTTPPVIAGAVKKELTKNNFEPMKAKDFADIYNEKTYANLAVNDDLSLFVNMPRRFGDLRHNFDPKSAAANKDTLEINRLLRRLETAIAKGELTDAAIFARELAQLKINCSVIRQKPQENDKNLKNQDEVEFTIEMFVEDRLSHRGPFPLRVTPNQTVAALKAQVQKEFEIPVVVQRWILGKELAIDDKSTLKNLHVTENGCPVFLYLVAPAKDSDNAKSESANKNAAAEKVKVVDFKVKETVGLLPPSTSKTEIVVEKTEVPKKTDSKQIPKEQAASTSNTAPVLKQEVSKNEDVFEEYDSNTLKAQTSDWECKICTLLNPSNSNVCAVCSAVRLKDEEPVVPPSKGAKRKAPQPKARKKEANDQQHYLQLVNLDNADLVENSEPFECAICLTEIRPGQGVTLRECLHQFCKLCLAQTIEFTEDAEIKCPFRDNQYSCDLALQDREIKALVSATVYDHYLARSVAQAENKMDKSFHCKTPDCKGWCVFEDNVNEFRCPVCQKINCLTCQAIHSGMNCKQYQEKMNAECDTDDNAKQTREMLQEMVDKGEALTCPACQVVLMKKWGCDWVRCSMCRTEICWVTRGPRWGPAGKGDTTGGCKCGVNGVKCHPQCNYCH